MNKIKIHALVLFSFYTLFSSTQAYALCQEGGHRRHCKYYADSADEALEICVAAVRDLKDQGYKILTLDCGFALTGLSSGGNPIYLYGKGYREHQEGKNYDGFRYQAFDVLYNFDCDGKLNRDTGVCNQTDRPLEEHGCAGENGKGNPCNVSTGNKYQTETDFSTGGMSFIRSYNSQNTANLGVGHGWRHNYQRKLLINEDSLVQVSGSGRGELWEKADGIWSGESDTRLSITQTDNGFELTKSNGDIENYNLDGRIQSFSGTNGESVTYLYNADGLLDKVINHNGQSINFTYQNGTLRSVFDALQAEYIFQYYPNGNLKSIIYPDLTPNDLTDNPIMTYLYEDERFPNHLTAIIDENDNLFAKWGYDSEGRAILSQHAETSTPNTGQETFTFEHDYQLEAQQ